MNNYEPANPTDPRERLVQVGNQLLDTIYKLKQWELKWPELHAAMETGRDGAIPSNVGELMTRNMDGIMESLSLAGDYRRLFDEYYTLRSTIEAMENRKQELKDFQDAMEDGDDY